MSKTRSREVGLNSGQQCPAEGTLPAPWILFPLQLLRPWESLMLAKGPISHPSWAASCLCCHWAVLSWAVGPGWWQTPSVLPRVSQVWTLGDHGTYELQIYGAWGECGCQHTPPCPRLTSNLLPPFHFPLRGRGIYTRDGTRYVPWIPVHGV